MAAVEWASHATWNPQQQRMQLDDGAEDESEDSDGGETPERSHRTSASGRSQRVRTNSASTHGGVACQVNGCKADLSVLKHYHQRYKVCEFHLKQTQVEQDGVLQRFCQQCSRFHELAEFDGTRRSCRMRLQRHNARRRKKAAERPTSKKMALAKGRLAAAGFQHHAPALSVPKQSQRLAAKAARAGGGAQRSESDGEEPAQLLEGGGGGGGGCGGKMHGGLLSPPDPSAWPFAAALRGDSIAEERHLQELMAGAGWRPGALGQDGLLSPTSPGAMQPQLSIPYLMQHARLCARGLSPELDPLGPAAAGFAGGGIGGIGGLGRLGTPLPAVFSAASGQHGGNGVGGSYAGDTALRAFLGQPGSLGGQAAAQQHRGSLPGGGVNGFAGHAASNGGGGSMHSIFGNESAAKEAARLYDAAMQQQSLDAFLNPGWMGAGGNGGGANGGHSGANGGLAPFSQLSGGPMQQSASTQNSFRRQSGNDGAYRVLEKMAQRRSVNLGDTAALGLLNGGGHAMGPPLMVHRTGSAPPAPGSSPLQAAAPVRSRLSVQSPHEVMARAMMLTSAQPMDSDGGIGSEEELRGGLGGDPLGPRRASESAAHTQQWLPNPGYHHHSSQQQQQQQGQQQHGHGMPPSFGTTSAGMLSGSMTNGAANPFQRSAQMAAAATAGITQSALQEANALLDLRVQGTPSGAAAGNATLSAGSRFSPQPPQNPGSGNQPDPMTSPAAADRASAQQQQQQQHVPTMRLLSGHNSGNTFSGVPHGFRVEAGGDAAALLCNGGGGMMGSGGAADGAEARGAGTPHTVKTTSRGSTGGDMGPPPPSATVRTPSDNHSQLSQALLSASESPVIKAAPPLGPGAVDSDRGFAAGLQPGSANGEPPGAHAVGAEPPLLSQPELNAVAAQNFESDLMPAPASVQLYT